MNLRAQIRNQPIARKISEILVLSTGLILLLTISVFTVIFISKAYSDTETQLRMLAVTIGDDSQAALKLGNREQANKELTVLRKFSKIQQAQIYDLRGQEIAQYKDSPGQSVLHRAVRAVLPTKLLFTQDIVAEGVNVGHIALEADMTETWIELMQTLFAVLLAAAVSMFLSVRLGQRLISHTTTAISSLASAAEKVVFDQNYDVRVESGAADEVGSLVETFNGMLVELQVRNDVLWEYQVSLEQQVETRTAELRAAMEEAKAANLAKSEFLASMSHELRTPLNVILGYAQLFSMDPQLPEDVKQQAVEIERAGKHLLDLVNDLIDLARIESGKLGLVIEPVQVMPVVRYCMEMVAPIAQSRGVALNYDNNGSGAIWVRADNQRFRQVLINLLSNAIKYNRPQGNVKLDFAESEGMVRIAVTDTGLGISTDKRARLFNAFDRLGAERGLVEGSGIGLIITRSLVEAMDGHLGFDSIEGQGSTFWVELPITAASITAATAAVTDTKTEPRVVLYIEDNPLNLRLMRQVFATRPDLKLLDAHTAEFGLNLASSHLPALIMMDINLPHMDGYAALALLKADPRTAHIPVIAVTASAMSGDKEYGLAAGFFAYITKPIDIKALFTELDKAVGPVSPGGGRMMVPLNAPEYVDRLHSTLQDGRNF